MYVSIDKALKGLQVQSSHIIKTVTVALTGNVYFNDADNLKALTVYLLDIAEPSTCSKLSNKLQLIDDLILNLIFEEMNELGL